MATLKLGQFAGEIPRIIPRLLPDSSAQRAENVRLDDGALTPIRQALRVHTVDDIPEGQIKAIYKHGEQWLAWDAVVNAAPGPVAADRLYYTGDGVPKMRVGDTIYPLAVPMPPTALIAALGGVATDQSIIERLYVYTNVTSFGEESEPCPVSAIVNWQAGLTVTLSGFTLPAAGRAITKQRIYRSQSSNASGTGLFFIAERNVSSADYVDAIAPDAFGEPMPSLDWNPPPDDLAGLTPLFAGMMGGFSGKELCLSEPYRPHTWPEKYRLTMDYNIVALGAFGTTIVVLTDGQPYLVQGNAPENMVPERVEKNYPCINARGVVDLGYGIAYPSQDGLVVASSASIALVTEPIMTRDTWQTTSPATFVAGQFNGRYFASYEYVENDIPERGTLIIDLTGSQPFVLRGSRYASACYYDVKDSALYMLSGTGVYLWNALGEVPEIMTYRSKQFVLPAPASFGCILIEGADFLTPAQRTAIAGENASKLAENQALFSSGLGGSLNGAQMAIYDVNGDALNAIDDVPAIAVTIYADGVPVATVATMNQVCRLPPISRASIWEVEAIGTASIAQIALATTPRELNGI